MSNGIALLVPWLDLPLSHVHEGKLYPFVSVTLSTRKMQQWKWTAQCLNAFDVVMKMLVNALVLAPQEFGKPFVVIMNASDYGIGAVLLHSKKKNTR